jgi:hypothetical protein
MPNAFLAQAAKKLRSEAATDLVGRARAALAKSRIYVLRKLDIEPDGDALILRGNVDSFYHKQLAQELVRMAVEGVEVINAIAVVYNARPDDSSFDFHW